MAKARKKNMFEKTIRKRMTYMKRRNLPNKVRAPVYHRARMEREHGRYNPILGRRMRYQVRDKNYWASKIQGLARGRATRNDIRGEVTDFVDRAAYRRGIPLGVRNTIRQYAGVPSIIPGRFNNLGMSIGGRGHIGRARGTGFRGGLGAVANSANPRIGLTQIRPFPTRRGRSRPNNALAARIRANMTPYK